LHLIPFRAYNFFSSIVVYYIFVDGYRVTKKRYSVTLPPVTIESATRASRRLFLNLW